MKNANMNDVLKKAMDDFGAAYDRLRVTIDRYERTTGTSVNDLKSFTESYPFDKSFDELAVEQWVTDAVEGIEQCKFQVLNYCYYNTGGNTMVGISEVWLPEEKRTVWAFTNEEGCTLSVVDYIRNELSVDDYEEFIIDYIDWGRITGYEKYFELYRHCYNEYLKDDSKYFGTVSNVPYYLLSDELQQQISAEYKDWFDITDYDGFDTDGVKIFVHSDYKSATDVELDKWLQEIKDFKQWHRMLPADDDTLHAMYEKRYELRLGDKVIQLPFFADVFGYVEDLLDFVIEEW